MPKTLEVKIPDIGDFAEVAVIEVMVKPGDTIKPEDPLITLESDKATMDVPSPAGGQVKDVRLKVGDKVSQGTLILPLETAEAAPAPAAPVAPAAGDGESRSGTRGTGETRAEGRAEGRGARSGTRTGGTHQAHSG